MNKKQALMIGIAAFVVILVTSGIVLASPPQQGPLPQPTPQQPGVVPSGAGLTGANRPQGSQPAAQAPLLPASNLVPPARSAGVGSSPAGTGLQPNRQATGAGPEAAPTGQMSYQGKLLDNGTPYTGDIDITFRLYTVDTGGTAWWEETQTVHVETGLFNVMLGAIHPLTAYAVNFQSQQWLGIQPAGEPGELTPRQPLGAVGYAMNLVPGATVVDYNPPGFYQFSLWVSGNDHGGIYGDSGVDNGVFGVSGYTGTAGVRGAGYGAAGVGVQGTAPNATFNNWPWAIGVRGSAGDWGMGGEGWYGVVGWGTVAGGGGIGGEGFYTYTSGVNGFAHGAYASGVSGYANGAYSRGVYGYVADGSATDNSAGVWGEVTSGDGIGVRGNKDGGAGAAVYGTNVGASGSGVAGVSTNWAGTWGESTNYYGVYGRTYRSDNNYGLYTDDNLYSLNFHSAGAIMQLAQNSGSAPLEPGDVVVFSGMSAPLENGIQVVQVARADTAGSSAVAGVVYSGYNIAVVTAERRFDGRDSPTFQEITPAGPVAPGEYLLVVVQGPAQVKASAAAGAIQPGDLLMSAGQAGYAARAAEVEVSGVRLAPPGTVFGKALEAVVAGEKTIYVFVTLH